MNPLSTLLAYGRLRRSQRASPEAIRALQETKLQRLVAHACATVPYYRRLFDGAGVDPASIRTVVDLERVPFTTKADLQAAGTDALSSAFAREALVREKTSGSTGQPFAVHFDRSFLGIRNALFLRTLVAAGYAPGQRLLIVTDERAKQPPPWMRWRYALNLADDATLARDFAEFRPHVVYGPVTPLRRMAVGLEAAPASWRPRRVVTTAETLEPATRRHLETVFGAEDVIDVYGLTESGMLAWECPWHAGYHLSEDTAVVEPLPEEVPGGGHPLVVTTLDLLGMPFIRYRTNDLVRPGESGRCRCGRTLRRLERIEGRVVDCVRALDGRAVSPYAVTHVLGPIPGLERYRVVQETLHDVLVEYEQKPKRPPPDEAVVRHGLRDLLGPDTRVRVEGRPSLEPPPGRKFRLVECRLDDGTLAARAHRGPL